MQQTTVRLLDAGDVEGAERVVGKLIPVRFNKFM